MEDLLTFGQNANMTFRTWVGLFMDSDNVYSQKSRYNSVQGPCVLLASCPRTVEWMADPQRLLTPSMKAAQVWTALAWPVKHETLSFKVSCVYAASMEITDGHCK